MWPSLRDLICPTVAGERQEVSDAATLTTFSFPYGGLATMFYLFSFFHANVVLSQFCDWIVKNVSCRLCAEWEKQFPLPSSPVELLFSTWSNHPTVWAHLPKQCPWTHHLCSLCHEWLAAGIQVWWEEKEKMEMKISLVFPKRCALSAFFTWLQNKLQTWLSSWK